MTRPVIRAIRRRWQCDRGMVTVEMAAALPVLMVLVLAGLYAVRVVDARTQCLDAAREVARAAARGDAGAVAAGRAALPSGSSISVRTSAGSVTAVVIVRVHPGQSSLPAVTVTEQATAALETVPTAGSPGQP